MTHWNFYAVGILLLLCLAYGLLRHRREKSDEKQEKISKQMYEKNLAAIPALSDERLLKKLRTYQKLCKNTTGNLLMDYFNQTTLKALKREAEKRKLKY